MKRAVKKKDVIYPELSYDIVGCAYEVWDELGAGNSEEGYQKALAVALKKKGLSFTEKVEYPDEMKSGLIGKGVLDFLVEEKVVIALKNNDFFSKQHTQQVANYIKLNNYKLAILLTFPDTGLQFKRIAGSKDPVEPIKQV
jgi:GxxExxY protein